MCYKNEDKDWGCGLMWLTKQSTSLAYLRLRLNPQHLMPPQPPSPQPLILSTPDQKMSWELIRASGGQEKTYLSTNICSHHPRRAPFQEWAAVHGHCPQHAHVKGREKSKTPKTLETQGLQTCVSVTGNDLLETQKSSSILSLSAKTLSINIPIMFIKLVDSKSKNRVIKCPSRLSIGQFMLYLGPQVSLQIMFNFIIFLEFRVTPRSVWGPGGVRAQTWSSHMQSSACWTLSCTVF